MDGKRTGLNGLQLILGMLAATALFCSGSSLAAPAKTDPAEQCYQEARQVYLTVVGSAQLRGDPKNWEQIIKRYEQMAASYPRSRRAPEGLYMAARCSARLYEETNNPAFLQQSIKLFSQLAQKYPSHHLSDDALYYVGSSYEKLGKPDDAAQAYRRVLRTCPSGDFHARARDQLQRLGTKTAQAEVIPQDSSPASSPVPLSTTLQKKLKGSAGRFISQQTTIVLDPGHGGKDTGAIGRNGLMEKDVVLKISRLLAGKLQKLTNVKVFLTRSEDRFLSLEKRTAIANSHGANLFISIHLNALDDPSFSGVETYFLNLTNDPHALAVAAKENVFSKKKLSDLELILTDLLQDAKIKESSGLAEIVQGELYTLLAAHGNNVRNLGVKQAPFYVLLGANMPSVLVETAFLSNPQEEQRLNSATYLNLLADGLYKGITSYRERLTVAYR